MRAGSLLHEPRSNICLRCGGQKMRGRPSLFSFITILKPPKTLPGEKRPPENKKESDPSWTCRTSTIQATQVRKKFGCVSNVGQRHPFGIHSASLPLYFGFLSASELPFGFFVTSFRLFYVKTNKRGTLQTDLTDPPSPPRCLILRHRVVRQAPVQHAVNLLDGLISRPSCVNRKPVEPNQTKDKTGRNGKRTIQR